MGSLVGADVVGDMEHEGILFFGGGLDKAVDGFEDADFAKEIYFRHGKGRVHWPAASGAGQAIAEFERIVAGGLERTMANFGVTGFVPGDARQIVFGLEIFEPYVPDECAEGLDGVDLVALGADKTKADVFVGVFWKTSFAIGCIIVAGVFEGVEARIAERDCAALKRLRLTSKR